MIYLFAGEIAYLYICLFSNFGVIETGNSMRQNLRYFTAFVLFWLVTLPLNGQKPETGRIPRSPAVAGSFYPSQPQELRKMVDELFQQARVIPGGQPLALVVPHAGYVFSGRVAAAAFKQLDPGRTFSHIFLIGPNHKVYLNGINIYTRGDFSTPLGIVPLDPLAGELAAKFRFIQTDPAPHRQEHCLEVQLPFLQYGLKKPFSIIPILIGGESTETARQLGTILSPYFTEDNLFIISTDFSHYPEYSVAQKADRLTADAILSNNPASFIKVKEKNEADYAPGLATSICGWMPVLTLLHLTEKNFRIEYQKILYENSGDSPYGDHEKVVGYWAISVIPKASTPVSDDFNLTDKDKITLLKIARSTIIQYLQNRNIPAVDEKLLSGNMNIKAGAFVTLRKNKQLRGCIGNFMSDEPLVQTIREMAVASATQDSRFYPVDAKEMDKVQIEISVLTPLHRIISVSEFKLGRDGIYMRRGNKSGTFLPQVAEETGWNTEEFLGHCARDKANIGWDGWKDSDTELYTYRAIVFSEEDYVPGQSKKQE